MPVGSRPTATIATLPRYAWLGLLLVLVFWPLNWLLDGLRTHIGFFPMWLGYILIVDSVVLARTGSSLLHRSPRRFWALFPLSIPLWWLFEAINLRTGNWHYEGAELFSPTAYALFASLSFSTVVPAVLETAELVMSTRWIIRFRSGPPLPGGSVFVAGLFAGGWIMLVLLLLWPTMFYPLTWGALYAIVEPVNYWRGRPTLVSRLQRGIWSPLVALSAGALVCGFFWEFWNYYSYPRWTYATPGVTFWYVFEMPALGYIGYLPFAWELYAAVHLVMPQPPELRLDGKT